MKISYIMGFMEGMLLVWIIKLLIKTTKKTASASDQNCVPQYDERQLQARGKAYKTAYFSLMACIVIEGIIDTFFEIKLFTGFVALGISIFISIGVFVVLCILNDAYLGLYNKLKQTIYIFAVVVVVNMASAIASICHGEKLIENGEFSEVILNIGIVVLFIVVTAVLVIKANMDKKMGTDE